AAGRPPRQTAQASHAGDNRQSPFPEPGKSEARDWRGGRHPHRGARATRSEKRRRCQGHKPWRGWKLAGQSRRLTAKLRLDAAKFQSELERRVCSTEKGITFYMAHDPLCVSALCGGLLPRLPVSDDQCSVLAVVSLRVWPRCQRHRAACVSLLPGI